MEVNDTNRRERGRERDYRITCEEDGMNEITETQWIKRAGKVLVRLQMEGEENNKREDREKNTKMQKGEMHRNECEGNRKTDRRQSDEDN